MIGYEIEYFSFLIIAVLFSAGNAKKKRFHSFHRSDRHNRRIQIQKIHAFSLLMLLPDPVSRLAWFRETELKNQKFKNIVF